MSPTQFNIYIEELITRIRKAEIGGTMGNTKWGCLGYTDDIVLITENKEDMNRMLQIVDEYGKEWQVKFSSKKCKIMEFTYHETGQWAIGNNIIRW